MKWILVFLLSTSVLAGSTDIPDVYPNHLKNWDFGCAKAPGLIDCKQPNIKNMGLFTIDQSQELSHQPKSNSSGGLGISAYKKHVIDERENYFQTSTPYKISPHVNPITGDLIEEERDLVVAGCQPLSVRRFYNHTALYEPKSGGWRYNPEAFFVANFDWPGQETFSAVGYEDGSIVSFHTTTGSSLCTFDPEHFTHFTPTGQTHPLNTKIQYTRIPTKEKNYFTYRGEIIEGNGGKRSFDSGGHCWVSNLVTKVVRKGYDIHATLYTPNCWTPYQLHVYEERKPNGNIICYSITGWKECKYFRRPHLLSSITAYNADKTQVLGSISFAYNRDKHQDVRGITAIGSDGRQVVLQHHGNSPILLHAVNRPDQPSVGYGYQGQWVNRVEKPEGRVITTEYNDSGKVGAQYAPVGPHGEMHPIGRYVYHAEATEVYDAEGNKTIYRFNDKKHITSLEHYIGDALYRTDRFSWDSNGNLIKKTVEDSASTILHMTEYSYDKNHNPIEEKIGDGTDWHTIYRTFSDDGFNLKLSESDCPGRVTHYAYVPETNLLTSEILYEGNNIRKRTFHTYNNAAVCLKTIIDDGSTPDPHNLTGVTYRTIKEIQPKQTLPCFGLPEIVLEKTINTAKEEILLKKIQYVYTPFGKVAQEDHYDGDHVYCYSVYNEYDSKERLSAKTDPLGNRTTFTYDDNSNLLSVSGPRNDQHKEITYDKANRPICVADRQSDGSLLITKKKYNKLGQVVVEIDACGNSTRFEYDPLGRCTAVIFPDGGVEKREYNVLGYVTKAINPLGYETHKTYNFKGQLLSAHYPDGSEEHFTYFAHGPLASQIDKNGAKTVYTLDVFDHPIKSATYSSSQKLLKTTLAIYSPFHKLSDTDCKGITTAYSYDYAGKKIAEKKENIKRHFVYDSLGRLEQTQEGEIAWIEKHDFLNRVIEKRTEKQGKIQFQENYLYDPAGNRIQTINSQGTHSMEYNTYGKATSSTDLLGCVTHFNYAYGTTLTETTTNPHHIQTIQIHDSKGRERESLKKNRCGEIIQHAQSTFNLNDQQTDLTHTVFDGIAPIKIISHHWDYGPMGRIERIIESGVKQTEYLYDVRGRLQTIIKPNGVRLNHEYDDLGRLARYFSDDFDYHYTYDLNDSLLSIYDSVTNTKTTRTYDAHNNIIQEDLAHDLSISNIFDSYNRRISLNLPDTSAITYRYDGVHLFQVQYKGRIHIYAERNLEGEVLRSILPGDLGEFTIQRDALGRWQKVGSRFYTSEMAYDAVGNLVQNNFQDSLGQQKLRYVFDDLDQLICEKEHTYECDSLYNRLRKDSFDYDVNALCQIIHDGQTPYTFDANGNLTTDGSRKLIYDSQDRLIAIEEKDKRLEYAYDPFHRRLWKKVFVQGSLVKYDRYLWDGDNEIGVVDEQGVIQELRVLGEGLGAEIGAAVLYEIRGTAYVPLHDVQGSLVTLMDLESKKPVECYRYTAYGEELTDKRLSPWRFSSKRADEIGLIFFGRRYYHAELGRWITQDPEGFDHGPNLYAYVNNCPLTCLDLYGLFEFMPFQRDYRLPHYLDYERSFWNKSCSYDLSILDKPNLPNGCIFFTNGMLNTLGQASRSSNYISDLSGGYNIHTFYNPTHGLFNDVREASLGLLGVRTNPVLLLKTGWEQKLATLPPDKFGMQFCHSHGAIYTKLALEDSPDEIRKRIRVVAIAPAVYIPREICHSVQHYEASFWRDPIPHIDWRGRRQNRHTITVLPSHPNAPRHDHSITSPTFERVIQDEVSTYLDTIGKQ